MANDPTRRTLLRYLLSVAAILAIAATVTCGGSSKASPTVTATPVSDEAFLAAAEQAARTSLLTLGDMPPGWTATAHTADSASSLYLPAAGCRLLNEDVLPNAVLNKDADDFAGASNESIGSGVAVYRTAELASTNMSEFAQLEMSCANDLAEAYKGVLTTSAHFDDLTTSAAEVKVPDVASARVLRIAFSGHLAGVPFAGHGDVGFVVSRRIASGITVFLLDGTPSPPRIEDLLALMLQRAAGADRSLPD